MKIGKNRYTDRRTDRKISQTEEEVSGFSMMYV